MINLYHVGLSIIFGLKYMVVVSTYVISTDITVRTIAFRDLPYCQRELE